MQTYTTTDTVNLWTPDDKRNRHSKYVELYKECRINIYKKCILLVCLYNKASRVVIWSWDAPGTLSTKTHCCLKNISDFCYARTRGFLKTYATFRWNPLPIRTDDRKPCITVYKINPIELLNHKDEINTSVGNLGMFLPNYIALHPRRQ